MKLKFYAENLLSIPLCVLRRNRIPVVVLDTRAAREQAAAKHARTMRHCADTAVLIVMFALLLAAIGWLR